jgi:hypothetical protein
MATAFLHYLGTAGFTASSGYVIAPFNLLGSTELSGLANGSVAISSTGGSSGIFNQVNFSSAQYGEVYLTVVTTSWIGTTGGNISGWWLHGANSSTNLEAWNVTTPPVRPPDWIIPVNITAAVGSTFFAAGTPVALPYDTVKVVVQNNCGATTGAGNHTIIVAPVADQY